jgi:hypothetical protein
MGATRVSVNTHQTSWLSVIEATKWPFSLLDIKSRFRRRCSNERDSDLSTAPKTVFFVLELVARFHPTFSEKYIHNFASSSSQLSRRHPQCRHAAPAGFGFPKFYKCSWEDRPGSMRYVACIKVGCSTPQRRLV